MGSMYVNDWSSFSLRRLPAKVPNSVGGVFRLL
jgi:hypothetical protein